MLRLTDIDKTYGATRAVTSVTLAAAPGSVLGLVGENGAGKSTLIKIVSGAVTADRGEITLDGQKITLRNTGDAIACGISGVFQELTLVGTLSVERNLFLTSAPLTPWRSIDRRRLRRQATALLAQYGLEIDPAVRLGDLPLGQQQQIEIIRATERRPRVLLLDEATSALGATEVDWLAGLVQRLQQQGVILLFISHRWDEIMRFCDRVAILRNGDLISVNDTATLSEAEAVRQMTGQSSIDATFPEKTVTAAPVLLAADNLRSRVLRDVTLTLHQSEILGLGGLVGQGQGEMLQALFGAAAITSGTITIAGHAVASQLTPRRAIAAGIAYVPQERKSEGLLLSKSITTNMTLAILDRLRAVAGLIDHADEMSRVTGIAARAQIRSRGPHDLVSNLSGGNQQKVLLEKWLLTKPAILLLNDVTRGVDLATKHDIYRLVTEIARQGIGIIWYSTDARELVGVAHRVIVLQRGRINAELTGTDITTDRIVQASVVTLEMMPKTGDGHARIAS